MKARLISAAVICVAAFLVGVAAAQADTVQPGGSFTCDGLTGCYINSDFGGWLIDSCAGPTSFTTGPFTCTAHATAVPGGNGTFVYPDAVCSTWRGNTFDGFVKVYESTGTITARVRGTTVTLTATCGPNRL